MQPPKKRPTVLTRLRIDEVSLVDKAAGQGCKIVISKRDDSADDNRPVKMPEHERRYWQALGKTALRHAEERYAKEHGTGAADHLPADDEPEIRPTPADDPERFLFSKATFLRKTYAADAAGDEATREDEATPVDELDDGTSPPPPDGASGGVPAKHRSITFDTVDGTRMKFPNEKSLAEWLAIQSRIRKSASTEESNPMSFDLSAVVKAHGISALCRHMIKSASSFGIDEHQLVSLATEDAARRYPSDTPAMAFSKLYEENSELRDAIEIAKNVAFQDDLTAQLEKDAAEACAELQKIGNERWPSLSSAQRFARAAECNPQILKRAYRRPSVFAAGAFPHPVTKAMPLANVDGSNMTPQSATETNVDNPETALAQLRRIGRDRWPSASSAQQFLNAVCDSENAALVRAALGPPAGSSSPRITG